MGLLNAMDGIPPHLETVCRSINLQPSYSGILDSLEDFSTEENEGSGQGNLVPYELICGRRGDW